MNSINNTRTLLFKTIILMSLPFAFIGCATRPAWVSDQSGKTDLMSAVERGDLPTVKNLIERGAQVNAHCDAAKLQTTTVGTRNSSATYSKSVTLPNQGNTALSLAVLNGNVEITRYLVNHGADVKTKVCYIDGGVKLTRSADILDYTPGDFQRHNEKSATIQELARSRGNQDIIAIVCSQTKP